MWLLVAVIALIYYFSNLQKVLVPGVTFNELMLVFPGADGSQITRLGAAFMYPYAFMQLVTGLLADRYSGTRVIMVGGLFFTLGAVMTPLCGSLELLFAARMLTGCGAATIYLSAVKEIARLAPDSLAVFIALLTIIGYSGAVTGTSPFAIGLQHFGYRPMMLAAGCALAVVFAFFLVVCTMTKRVPVCQSVKFRLSTYVDVVKIRQNIWMTLLSGFSFGTYFALQSILGKKFLEDYYGMSTRAASSVLMATMLVAAFNSFVLAYISKFLGNRRKPFFLYTACGCILSMLMLFISIAVQYRSPWLPITAMLMLASAANGASICVASMKESNDDNHFGTALSISNFFSYLVTAVFGGIGGKILEVFPPAIVDGVRIYGQKSYLLFFAIMMFVVLGTLLAALNLKETNHPKK